MDARFENLMALFDARGIPRVALSAVEVISPEKVLPNLSFHVEGPRESTVIYRIWGRDIVDAWFGWSHHDSGGLSLQGRLRMSPDDLITPKPAIVLAKPEDVARERFLYVVNATRMYPRPRPEPPKPDPAHRVSQQLNQIINLHKRFMQSGRKRVLDRLRERSTHGAEAH